MEFPGAPVRSTTVKSVTFDQRQIISKSYAQQTAPSGPAPDTSINVSKGKSPEVPFHRITTQYS